MPYCCNNPNFPVNHGKFWSMRERSMARMMYRQGYSYSAIGRRLNRTVASIMAIV